MQSEVRSGAIRIDITDPEQWSAAEVAITRNQEALLAKFSREAGFLPYIGHAHHIYTCYLKSQINSSRPPSECDLSTIWSLQTELDKDMPKACSLAVKPSL